MHSTQQIPLDIFYWQRLPIGILDLLWWRALYRWFPATRSWSAWHRGQCNPRHAGLFLSAFWPRSAAAVKRSSRQ